MLTAAGESAIRSIGRLQLDRDITVEQSVIILCTIGEEHTGLLLDALIDSEADSRSMLEDALLRKLRGDIGRNWNSTFEWLRMGFGLNLLGDREVQDFYSCIELRNAIVHGRSRLTKLQTKNFNESVSIRKNLEKVLDVTLIGNRIRVDANVKDGAIKAARSYIIHIDRVVLGKRQQFLNLA